MEFCYLWQFHISPWHNVVMWECQHYQWAAPLPSRQWEDGFTNCLLTKWSGITINYPPIIQTHSKCVLSICHRDNIIPLIIDTLTMISLGLTIIHYSSKIDFYPGSLHSIIDNDWLLTTLVCRVTTTIVSQDVAPDIVDDVNECDSEPSTSPVSSGCGQ